MLFVSLALLFHTFLSNQSLPCISNSKFKKKHVKDLVFLNRIAASKIKGSFANDTYMYSCTYEGKPLVAKKYTFKNKDVISVAVREAIVMDELKSIEHVAKFKFCIKSASFIMIFMEELYDTLNAQAERFSKQSWDNKLNTIIGVTNSFAEIHKKKRIHGDIKTENLMVPFGTFCIKIIDFGYSVHIGNTNAGYSFLYSSPEHIGVKKPVPATTKQDVWSWLVTIMFLLFPYIRKNIPIFEDKKPNFMFMEKNMKLLENILKEESKNYQLPLYDIIFSWFQLDPQKRPEMLDISKGLTVLLNIFLKKKQVSKLMLM